MEKVNKVSISGISFTLEEKACNLIRSYLDALSSHYADNPNGSEILEGIESRIAELFIDRGGKSGIISASMAQEVIDIIGNPEQIFSDSEDTSPDNKEAESHIKKRLYRNPSDQKIGGVCGGLGAFFGFDPLWLRIGFLAMIVLSAVTSSGEIWNPALFVVLYLILWICMPLAVTTKQKCEMRGVTLSYNEIEHEVENRKDYEGSKKNKKESSRVPLRIILITLGVILVLTGVSGIIASVTLIFGLSIADLAIPEVVSNLFAGTFGMSVCQTILIKIFTSIIVILPFVGILYAGIALLFRIKAPVWKPGLVMLLTWIASLIGLSIFALSAAIPFLGMEEQSKNISLDNISDSLHIQFTDLDKCKDYKVFVKGEDDEFFLAYLDDSDKKNPTLVTYPYIEIHRSDKKKKTKLSYEDLSGNYYPDGAELCRVSSDTLYVSPVIYGRGRDLDKIGQTLYITLPDSVKVSIEEPFRHNFNKDFEFTDIDGGHLWKLLIKELI